MFIVRYRSLTHYHAITLKKAIKWEKSITQCFQMSYLIDCSYLFRVESCLYCLF